MKLSTYLVLAVSYLGVTSAASLPTTEEQQSMEKRRGCFQSGVGYGNKDRALDAARSACSGPLQGLYQRGESAVKCYNIGGNRSVKLSIQAWEYGTLGANECYKGLGDRIRACPKGDEKKVGNWLFRADPNKGDC